MLAVRRQRQLLQFSIHDRQSRWPGRLLIEDDSHEVDPSHGDGELVLVSCELDIMCAWRNNNKFSFMACCGPHSTGLACSSCQHMGWYLLHKLPCYLFSYRIRTAAPVEVTADAP